jgi:DNA processing protein
MAIGIDAAAHRAALDAGGTTAAVLGAGIDQIYPPANRRLYHAIVDSGAVVSEYPAGHASFKGCFPRRNRIIAALSRMTIVVEAGERSGALITASYALSFSRDVAAVPGRIDSDASAGANRLLRDGAHVITCADDALALAKFATRVDTRASVADPAHPALALGSDEAQVWQLLAAGGVSTDDLVHRTAWPAARCLVAISNLELQGLVSCTPSGAVHRR